MTNQIIKILILTLSFLALLFAENIFSQTPAYTLTLTNDLQVDNTKYEFDIYILRTGSNTFEYANNSQFFININPAIINGGTLTFTIMSGTCELNVTQQVLSSKVSFDAANNRLRIAAHSPSGAGTGTIISNSGLGTRLGRFRVTNTVTFAASQANLTWYNGPTGFFTKMFAYVSSTNVEITNASFHFVNLNNPPLPVELSEFTASVKRNNVRLNWTTTSEINNAGFDIERTVSKKNEWQKVGFMEGHGTTNEENHYFFDDNKLSTAKYKYRLKQIDYNGNFEYFVLNNPSEVSIGSPDEFSVSQNYPNPSNPKSKIDYQIPFNGKVTLKIYDILGREVVSLIDEVKEAGYYTAEFDGTNLASGVYFYRIIAEGEGKNFNKTLKMVLVK